jgi:hypothetical protein
MVNATSTEVQRDFGAYRELAEGSRGAPEPVTVLHGDRPSVVIVSAAEFARLKQRDKRTMATEELHAACRIGRYAADAYPAVIAIKQSTSQNNTDYTEKQIKPQITRKGSEVMALRARIDNDLARSAIPNLLSV